MKWTVLGIETKLEKSLLITGGSLDASDGWGDGCFDHDSPPDYKAYSDSNLDAHESRSNYASINGNGMSSTRSQL